MFYLLIGSIIGVVMGLTGSGGALVSLPLFMFFLGKDLKEASFLALVSVVLSSVINFIFQRKNTETKLALLMFAFSMLGTTLILPYKKLFSSFWIALIIALIALYSLFVTWFQKTNKREDSLPKSSPSMMIIFFTGLTLGVLTSLTGLGGGVVLMPICLNVFKLDEKKSLATSLLTISLSSLFSFSMQMQKTTYIIDTREILYMAIGVFCSVLLLRKAVSYMSAAQNQMTRKVVFTIVVLVALSKIFS